MAAPQQRGDVGMAVRLRHVQRRHPLRKLVGVDALGQQEATDLANIMPVSIVHINR